MAAIRSVAEDARRDKPQWGCAIRFCLKNADIFRTQLRAILRASSTGVKVMFPMISGIEELRQAKYLLEETKAELKEGKADADIGWAR